MKFKQGLFTKEVEITASELAEIYTLPKPMFLWVLKNLGFKKKKGKNA